MEAQRASPSSLSPQGVLVQWANEQESWIRILVEGVLARQGPLDDKVIDEAFETLLQVHGLGKDTESVNVPLLAEHASVANGGTPMTLDRLSDVVGVNALAAGQTIDFDNHLTVLFGQNASGKTGYARIIKRAAGARTHEDLLGNVASEPRPDEPRARFELTVDGIPQSVDWSNQIGLSPLDAISFFDSQAATLHVDSNLDYIFTPAELARFGDVTDAIMAVQTRIQRERSTRQSAALLSPNPFNPSTRVYELVQTLGQRTSLDELRDLANLGDDAEEQLERMRADYASLASGVVDALIVGVKRQLDDLNDLNVILSLLQSFDAAKYNDALTVVAEASSAVTELRAALFDAGQLAADADDTWQGFVEAGHAYAECLGLSHYPQETDTCLYCRQPLQSDALALLRRYREFLRGAAQSQLQVEREMLETLIPTLTPAQIERTRAALSTVEDASDPRQSAIRLLIDTQTALLLVKGRQTCTRLDLAERANDLTEPIQELRDRLETQLRELETKQSNQEEILPKLHRDIDDLEDRIKLRSHLDRIQECVENAASARQLGDLDQAISNRVRRSLTAASKRASEDLANQDFEQRFAEECAALEGPVVTLNFHGRLGSTQRKKLVFDHHPSDVLSEGEQKVLALADFLAESRMNDSRYPIMFDDPVSSLDYRRLGLVAARLAQLSTERQVIVLTHNIMFAAELLKHRQRNSERVLFMQVRDSGTEKGLIAPDVEPRLDTPSKLAARVDDAICQASRSDPSSQDDLISRAYDLMRSWCEAFAEQELLGNVTQRYRANVMMTHLDKIKVDRLSDAITTLSTTYERICGYIGGHSSPHEQNSVSRTIAELKRDWGELQRMRQQYSRA